MVGLYEYNWYYTYEEIDGSVKMYTNKDLYGFPDHLNIIEINENKLIKDTLSYYEDIGLNYKNISPIIYKNNILYKEFTLPDKFSIKFDYSPYNDEKETNLLRITHNKSSNINDEGQNFFINKLNQIKIHLK